MKYITGLLVKTDGSKATFKTIPANLESYYKTLDCELIDIVNRNIGWEDFRFNIICDDEALLKAPTRASAINLDCNYCLYGNLFVVGVDSETGDVRSLTRAEMKHLRANNGPFYVPYVGNHVHGLYRVS